MTETAQRVLIDPPYDRDNYPACPVCGLRSKFPGVRVVWCSCSGWTVDPGEPGRGAS